MMYSLINIRRSERDTRVLFCFGFFGVRGPLGDSGRQRNNTPLATDFPPTHLMRRWSPAPTPCWRCFQMCRDLQTREDGDVANNTAADKKSQSQLSRLSSRANSVARRGKKEKEQLQRRMKQLSQALRCTALPCRKLYHKHHFPIGWSHHLFWLG